MKLDFKSDRKVFLKLKINELTCSIMLLGIGHGVAIVVPRGQNSLFKKSRNQYLVKISRLLDYEELVQENKTSTSAVLGNDLCV